MYVQMADRHVAPGFAGAKDRQAQEVPHAVTSSETRGDEAQMLLEAPRGEWQAHGARAFVEIFFFFSLRARA